MHLRAGLVPATCSSSLKNHNRLSFPCFTVSASEPQRTKMVHLRSCSNLPAKPVLSPSGGDSGRVGREGSSCNWSRRTTESISHINLP